MTTAQRFKQPGRQQYMQCGQESMWQAAQKLLKKGILLVGFQKKICCAYTDC
jgi:hypothetical protein